MPAFAPFTATSGSGAEDGNILTDGSQSDDYSRPNVAALDKVEEMLEHLNISREGDITVIDSNDSSTPVVVTRAAYNHELRQLQKLLTSQTDLYNKLANSIPDKRGQLLRNAKSINVQISDQIQRIEDLAVKQQREIPDPVVEEGAVGGEKLLVNSNCAQNLENQEKVIIETINNIHKSMNAYPPEDLLMEQPAGLKVQLMNHQQYALTFG